MAVLRVSSPLRTWCLWALPTVILAVALLKAGLPEALVLMLQDVTGWLVVQGATLCGLYGDYNPVNHHFQVADFKMRLDFDCTAFGSFVILVLMVIVAPQRSCQAKLRGGIYCGLTLLVLNVFRLIGLGLLGTYAPDWFAFLHEYLQLLFSVLSIGLWILWFERGERTIHWLTWGGATLGCGLVASALLTSVREPLMALLTTTADRLFLLTAALANWTEHLWPMPGNGVAFIDMQETRVAVQTPWRHITFNFWGDVMILALLAGLIGGGLCLAARHRQWHRVKHCAKGLVAGGAVLLVTYLLTLVIFTWLFIFDPSLENGRTFLGAQTMTLLAFVISFSIWVLNRPERVDAT